MPARYNNDDVTFCLIFCGKITCCLILVLIVYVWPGMTASLSQKLVLSDGVIGLCIIHGTRLTCRLAATYDSVHNIGLTVDLRRNW